MTTIIRYRRAALLTALLIAAATLTGCPQPAVYVPDDTIKEEPKPPEPTLPPVDEARIKASGIEEFEVDGLKVILKPTPGKSVVAGELFIAGGVANLTPDNAGIEELALEVATTGGTKSTDRLELARQLQGMGSGIGSGTGRDYSTLGFSAIRPYFDKTWKLFAEVVTEPAFDEKQFTLDKDRHLDSLKAIKDDPDRYVGWIANELHFAGHPYATRPIGRLESVSAVDVAAAQKYYSELVTRERLLLVVVGDVDRATLEKRVKEDLASIPSGNYEPAPLLRAGDTKAAVRYDERAELPTNYMLGFFDAPSPTHPDYYPMLVAVSYLSDRLFEEVRTKRNLTYAVAAGLGSARRNYGYLYVTAVDPRATVPVMYDEIQRLADEPLSDKQLEDLLSVFLTEFFVDLETNSAQAGALGHAELHGGGWEQTLAVIDNIKRVTPAEVQRVASTYFKNVHWGYVGNPAAADEAQLTAR